MDCDVLLGRFSTQRVRANQVYQEYIQDRNHVHMNSTRWVTLTEFIKHLGREGMVRVDETEKGFYIAWIDNSPKALAKAVRRSSYLLSSSLWPAHSFPDILYFDIGCGAEERARDGLRRTTRARAHRGTDRSRHR